jgi:dihydrofolate reductase
MAKRTGSSWTRHRLPSSLRAVRHLSYGTPHVRGHGRSRGGGQSGAQTIVFSRTLREEDYPNITIVSENSEQALTDLKAKPGKDIWLFGGGSLFRSLLEARLVDAVEVSVIPVLLGEGIPLLPPKPSSERFRLRLVSSRAFKTGILSLEYAVEYKPV